MDYYNLYCGFVGLWVVIFALRGLIAKGTVISFGTVFASVLMAVPTLAALYFLKIGFGV